jgi:hypothetical protein
MTDAALQGFALQALNMAKRDLQRNKFNFLLATYAEGEGLHRMRRIEEAIIEKLGEDWLNSGDTKDAGFWILRQATAICPPEAIVFVSVINKFSSTKKMLALSREEQERHLVSHEAQHRAVGEGLLTMVDALFATAQTPGRVCLYVQDIHARRGLFIGQPEVAIGDQEQLGGRVKFFGEADGFTPDFAPNFTRRNP